MQLGECMAFFLEPPPLGHLVCLQILGLLQTVTAPWGPADPCCCCPCWRDAPLAAVQDIPLSIPLTRWPLMTSLGPSSPGVHAAVCCHSPLSRKPNKDVFRKLPGSGLCMIQRRAHLLGMFSLVDNQAETAVLSISLNIIAAQCKMSTF